MCSQHLKQILKQTDPLVVIGVMTPICLHYENSSCGITQHTTPPHQLYLYRGYKCLELLTHFIQT